MAKLLEGKPLAEKMRSAIKAEIEAMRSLYKKTPKLTALQIGADASSGIYVKNQMKIAESLGIEYELKTLPADAVRSDLDREIDGLNSDERVTAVILQRPVPVDIDVNLAIAAISPHKDAEGIHPRNLGDIFLGKCSACPCTAAAVMALLCSSGADIRGKEAVVVGHSDIVGKPIALMLLNNFATTTVCHIATAERGLVEEHVKGAEILVVATGKPELIKGSWIRPGAIVIDVGINKVGDKILGDVEFSGASQRASFITPVPGGVGPVTTMMLMKNTLELFKKSLIKG